MTDVLLPNPSFFKFKGAETMKMKQHCLVASAILSMAILVVFRSGGSDVKAQSGSRTYGGYGAQGGSVRQRAATFEEKFWNYLNGTQPASYGSKLTGMLSVRGRN